MLSFKRIFATQQQALDVYKSQLSKQKLFVEAFEGAPKGTPVKVALTITETGQSIALDDGQVGGDAKRFWATPGADARHADYARDRCAVASVLSDKSRGSDAQVAECAIYVAER